MAILSEFKYFQALNFIIVKRLSIDSGTIASPDSKVLCAKIK